MKYLTLMLFLFCLANFSSSSSIESLVSVPRSASPVEKNANRLTLRVFRFLESIWGKRVLSGQQDLTWNDEIDMYQRVINDTGRAPAILGFDFMNYTLSGTYSGQSQVEEALAHWNRGGLVSFCWHWRDPSKQTAVFYSNETKFRIPMKGGELNYSSEAFAQIQRDVDLIAGHLKRLEVPVLWRPLHEASGQWFWWGGRRTDGVSAARAQIALWRYLYHRMTHYHGLRNLIWVWNGQAGDWYPGDEYVDIVSEDVYADPKNYNSQSDRYQKALKISKDRRMVAMSENGSIPHPNAISQDKAWWLYFVTWNDGDTEEGVTDRWNFWTGEYHNTNLHKREVFHHPLVLTLDELPKFTELFP